MGRKEASASLPYVLVLVATLTLAIMFSLVAGLSRWQTLLLMIGVALLMWVGVFTFLRFTAKGGSNTIPGPDFYGKRKVIVEPPTGEPYPHHEDRPESPGLDQGQLTSHLPGNTPLTERLSHRGARKEGGSR